MRQNQIRRRWVQQQLEQAHVWPRVHEIMQRFHCSRASAYRDLDVVLRELADRNLGDVDLQKLRLQVFGRLIQRVPQLRDRDLVRLAAAFIPRQLQQQVQSAISVKSASSIAEDIQVTFRDYGALIHELAQALAHQGDVDSPPPDAVVSAPAHAETDAISAL